MSTIVSEMLRRGNRTAYITTNSPLLGGGFEITCVETTRSRETTRRFYAPKKYLARGIAKRWIEKKARKR